LGTNTSEYFFMRTIFLTLVSIASPQTSHSKSDYQLCTLYLLVLYNIKEINVFLCYVVGSRLVHNNKNSVGRAVCLLKEYPAHRIFVCLLKRASLYPPIHNLSTCQGSGTSVAYLSPWGHGLRSGQVHESFVMDKMNLEQVFLTILRYFPVRIIPPAFHTHISFVNLLKPSGNFTYHQV
jgi:hypothetical protein